MTRFVENQGGLTIAYPTSWTGETHVGHHVVMFMSALIQLHNRDIMLMGEEFPQDFNSFLPIFQYMVYG
jgi:hypothetical protein